MRLLLKKGSGRATSYGFREAVGSSKKYNTPLIPKSINCNTRYYIVNVNDSLRRGSNVYLPVSPASKCRLRYARWGNLRKSVLKRKASLCRLQIKSTP